MALSRTTVGLLALTCGVTIANVYYAQPLLHLISDDLRTSESAAGVIVTATQTGFAAGLLLIVPLGDIVARRPLLTALLSADAAALAGMAMAPNLAVLAVCAVVVGLTSVVVQMTIPYAATLATDEQRAATIGTLMGALLLGILLSRSFAGLLAAVAGWRSIYVVAVVIMALTAMAVARTLPSGGREVHLGYRAQMCAVLRLARTEPVLRWRAVIGASQFAAFSCFWTTVTFLLAGPAMGFNQAGIGVFALVGAAGAVCALGVGPFLGRHRDRRWLATGVSMALMLGSFGILAAGNGNLLWLVVGALLMDAFSQGAHVSNQAVIYELRSTARSRITTVYMTTYFFGGALGTTAGALVYGRFGWDGVCVVAAGFCLIGLLAWAATYRHEAT